MNRRTAAIAVSSASAWEETRGIFSELETLLSVQMSPYPSDGTGGDAVVMLGAGADVVDAVTEKGIPAFASVKTTAARLVSDTLRFTDSPHLDARLRNLEISVSNLRVTPVPARDGDDVLATVGSAPIWVQRRAGGRTTDLVGVEPVVGPGSGTASMKWDPDHVVTIVPLLHFLRRVGGSAGNPPPLRACFLIDDPNLRWWSYGHVRYRDLAGHAARHGYHISISMIPIDAALFHPGVVNLFARNRQSLSLSMQGNNHTHRELASPSADSALRTVAQAIRRIERFEDRTGLSVDKVMVPPHGGLSAAGLSAAARLGLEGVAASPWSLPDIGRSPYRGAGLNLALLGPNSLSIVLRRHLRTEQNWLALHAYLGHGVVIYLHHEDLSGGLDVLTEASARVDALGPVHWSSLENIVRSRFSLSVESEKATLRMLASRVEVVVPDDVGSLIVEHPGTGSGNRVRVADENGVFERALGERFPVRSGTKLDVTLLREVVDAGTVAAPPWTPWPGVRRVLTENRDRIQPLVRRRS